MAYELFIGGRYLFGNGVDKKKLAAGIAFGLVSLLGYWGLRVSHGESVLAAVAMMGGMFMSAALVLMSMFSVFTSMSALGVSLGVAALVISLSATAGFQAQFREKVLGVNAHVIIMKQVPFADYRNIMDAAKRSDAKVLAAQPFIFAEMLVTRGGGQMSATMIKGVDPELVTSVLDLNKHMVAGSVAALGAAPAPGQMAPVILGRELANKIGAKLGDDITVVVPLSNVDFKSFRSNGSAPMTRKFRVVGIFYSGFDEYDRRLMYMALRDVQALRGWDDEVMGVELKLSDVDAAAGIAAKLRASLGEPPYQIQDWYELNKNLFSALDTQKVVLVLILGIIVVVATFNTVSSMFMMVKEKTAEVAILKSMGARGRSVALTFQLVGVVISAAGVLFGITVGLITCHVVEDYVFRLDPRVYLIDRLPIVVSGWEVLIVGVANMLVAVLVVLIPSWAASSLHPVQGLRHE